MTTSYILIDYENVQPKDVAVLNGHSFNLFVFVGANQNKIPVDLAEALQTRGENARYVRIQGNGRNALDFHIALYLGELCAKDPDGCFYVISKDKGFDPLIRFLGTRKVKAHRFNALAEIPLLAAAAPKTLAERIDYVIRNLATRGASKPRKRKTLASTINALFDKALEELELRQLIDELERRGKIAISDGAVTYDL
jgi:hypothetical protein